MEYSRSPHGERGLKSIQVDTCHAYVLSLPTRGAWIEIVQKVAKIGKSESLPTRGAWIEI